MSKRDLIEEILEKKRRTEHDWLQGSFAFADLEDSFEKLKAADIKTNAFYSLMLVGIVSGLEVIVRNGIRELIDAGSPYLDNVFKFKDILKFDLNITRALHDRKISFGELVSHLLPINNIENILQHFSVLLDTDFKTRLTELREFVEPSDEELMSGEKPAEPQPEPPLIIDDIEDLMRTMANIFRLRHITAHEADFFVATEKEVRKYLDAASLFTTAIGEAVEQTIRPNAPRASFGMSLMDATAASESHVEMTRVFETLEMMVEAEKPTAAEHLKNSQKLFEEYMEAEREFQYELIQPVSANWVRTMESGVMKKLCDQRLEVLRQFSTEYSRWLE